MISDGDRHWSKISVLHVSSWSDRHDSSPADCFLTLKDDSTFAYLDGLWFLNDNSVEEWSKFFESDAHFLFQERI